jgi:hypothetical protein
MLQIFFMEQNIAVLKMNWRQRTRLEQLDKLSDVETPRRRTAEKTGRQCKEDCCEAGTGSQSNLYPAADKFRRQVPCGIHRVELLSDICYRTVVHTRCHDVTPDGRLMNVSITIISGINGMQLS